MTRIAVETGAGRGRVELRSSQLTPRLLSTDATGARVALVATQALLLGGDEVHVDITVGAGAWLDVVEVAGTVAYDAAGARAGWSLRAQVHADGLLLYSGEPFVIADGANVEKCTTIDLGAGAMACIRETLILGRTGERGGSVRTRTRVRQRGIPLLVEDLDFREHDDRSRPGILGLARVLDTVTLLGIRAPESPVIPPGDRFELHGPGTLARCHHAVLAGSPVAEWSRAWTMAAAAAHRAH